MFVTAFDWIPMNVNETGFQNFIIMPKKEGDRKCVCIFNVLTCAHMHGPRKMWQKTFYDCVNFIEEIKNISIDSCRITISHLDGALQIRLNSSDSNDADNV